MGSAAWTRGDWLGLIGIFVSALGFAIAIKQLASTAHGVQLIIWGCISNHVAQKWRAQ